MQYSLYLNQQKAIEWGLNASQAMLFAFLYELPSWADPVTFDGRIYHRISKGKVIEELPLLTDKPDTVYRLMCQLRDAGLVEMTTLGNQTLLAITAKAKTWNRANDEVAGSEKNPAPTPPEGRKNIRGSEKNPGKVGKKSEPGSEKNPTYQITNNQITKSDSSLRSEGARPSPSPVTGVDLPDWLARDDWLAFVDHRKNGLRKALTAEAQRRVIRELEKLRDQGQDPAAVINQSIVNGWAGLFAVKGQQDVLPGRHSGDSIHDRRAATIAGLTGRNALGYEAENVFEASALEMD